MGESRGPGGNTYGHEENIYSPHRNALPTWEFESRIQIPGFKTTAKTMRDLKSVCVCVCVALSVWSVILRVYRVFALRFVSEH